MKHKHIFIVGGTGFLGYHTSVELVRRGAEVTVLAMPEEVVDEGLASRVRVERADIDQLNDEEIARLLSGHDAIIYAAGPDDRVELPAGVRAADFFGEKLVDRTERVLCIAKDQGVQKAVVFGSYFAYINNHGLCGIGSHRLERHPYIKARVEQTKRAFALGSETFAAAILNIPYVFGTAPGKQPIWKHVFVDSFSESPKIYYGKGGTTVISAKKIALCAAQALELAEHGDELAIGSVNMKFSPMIRQLLLAAHIEKPVAEIPTWLQGLFMKQAWKKMQAEKRDSGLDLRYLAKDILGRDFFVDFTATDERLQLQDFTDDVDAAIQETGERMRQ